MIIFLSLFIWVAVVRAQFNGQRAFSYLKKQVDFGPRTPGSKGHAACLKYLVEQMKRFTPQVKMQTFVYQDMDEKKQFQLTNVIASFRKDAPRRIFLAAHWDTRPRADYDKKKENRNKPIPGANDGASGVAVLLEIARQLKENPPAIGVDLILFDGEDYGKEGQLDKYFLGSRYFAKHAGNYHPQYGILLDMIGDAQLNIPKEGYSNRYLPQIVDKVWRMAASLGYSEFEDRVGSFIDDDHTILLKHGIPCIDVIDFSYPNPGQNYWHTLQDTPDKCSPASLQIVGRVMLEVIYSEE